MCPFCQTAQSGNSNNTLVTDSTFTNTRRAKEADLSIFGNSIILLSTDVQNVPTSNTTIDGNPIPIPIPEPSGCTCIIDSSIPGLGNKLGLDNPSTFAQYCGNDSVCIQVDNITGEEKTVPCAESLSDITFNEYDKPIPLWAWIISIAILVLGILAILAVYFDPVITEKFKYRSQIHDFYSRNP
jgi:hypothetical protein